MLIHNKQYENYLNDDYKILSYSHKSDEFSRSVTVILNDQLEGVVCVCVLQHKISYFVFF